MTDSTINGRTIGFTLNRLANAMRRLPRDAPVLRQADASRPRRLVSE
jgi:hypothetical protein